MMRIQIQRFGYLAMVCHWTENIIELKPNETHSALSIFSDDPGLILPSVTVCVLCNMSSWVRRKMNK